MILFLEKKSTITRFDFTVELGNSERYDRQLLLDSEPFSNDHNLLLDSEQSGNSEKFYSDPKIHYHKVRLYNITLPNITLCCEHQLESDQDFNFRFGIQAKVKLLLLIIFFISSKLSTVLTKMAQFLENKVHTLKIKLI